ncbi:MAG: hypothetical protein KatS3mg032_0058 [Cyclobacteriaceae bacterium]|nr:MAG: hypothetical protein KatS3mg032_0058 [Cyclobacteriaceae bacterium]
MRQFLLFAFLFLLGIVQVLAQPAFTIQNKKDACDGLSNGSFEILVTAANPPPLRAFIFGPPDQGPYNLTVGVPFLISGLPGQPSGKTYLVVVQDADGSTVQFVTIFAVSPDLSASVVSATNNSNCVAPDGSIDISVSGGTGSYSYQWSGPPGFTNPGTQDLSGIAGGTYSVLISDNGTNCTRTLGPVTITDPSPAIQNVTTPSPQIVCSGNDASISLAATQPAPVTYQVLINGTPFGSPQTNPSAPGPFTLIVPAGSFANGDVLTVQAVDGLCTPVLMNGSVTVNIQSLSVSSSVNPNSRCFPPFNGSIDITVSGAIGSLSYNWTGPGGPYTTEDLSGIEQGTYTVTVTDNTTSCQVIEVINVPDARPALSLTSSVTPNSRCVAPFNGAIDLTVSGSAGPFTYSWTGPGGFTASTEDISNLQDGAYNVTVTDVPSGCTASANINVNNTAPTLSLSSAVTANSRCVAPFNGAIDLTVSGSAGPFTYSWTGPGGFTASTEDISNLQDGAYNVTVTDVPSGCTASANINVNNTAPTLSLSSAVTANSRCVAPFNGAIDLTVSGSAGPFTYSWTGPGGFTASTEDISNLQDGAYNVTVTDVPSGCTASANINVNSTAPALSLSSAVTANSRCVAPFNGAIDLTVSGSAGPFTYSWTGPGGFTASTEDISNLQDGAYNVTVTDVPSGCTASANINVNNTAPARLA